MSKFVENIFDPILQFMDRAMMQTNDLSYVAAKGVRLDNYFGFFGILGPEWSSLISSLLASLVFLFVLYLIKQYTGVILWFKALIKWW